MAIDKADQRRLDQLRRSARVNIVDVALRTAAQQGVLCAENGKKEHEATLSTILFDAWRTVYDGKSAINVVRLDFDGITTLNYGTGRRVVGFFLVALRSVELKPCYAVVDNVLDNDSVGALLNTSLNAHKLVVVGRKVNETGQVSDWQLFGGEETVDSLLEEGLWTELQTQQDWIWGNQLAAAQERRAVAARLEALSSARLILRAVQNTYPYYRAITNALAAEAKSTQSRRR